MIVAFSLRKSSTSSEALSLTLEIASQIDLRLVLGLRSLVQEPLRHEMHAT